MILLVAIVAATLTAKATDIVTLKGNSNRVKMLRATLQYAAQAENLDATFLIEVTSTSLRSNQDTYTHVYVNGAYFGKVQLSRTMYAKVLKECFSPTSSIQRHLIVTRFCAQQSAFLRRLLDSLSQRRKNVPSQRTVYVHDTVVKVVEVVKYINRPTTTQTQKVDCASAVQQWYQVQNLYNARQINRRQAKAQFAYLKQSFPQCVSHLKPKWRNAGLKIGLGVAGTVGGIYLGSKLLKRKSHRSYSNRGRVLRGPSFNNGGGYKNGTQVRGR